MTPPCKHCGTEPAAINSRSRQFTKRGLCVPCFLTPAIKALYPHSFMPVPEQHRVRDMTEAELDAMIAEREATMPPCHLKPASGIAAALRRGKW